MIDLAGHKLEFYSDTVDPNMVQGLSLTITNSDSEKGTFTYYDENIDLFIGKDETVVFTKDYDDEESLPGIYEVVVNFDRKGEVVGEPKLDRSGVVHIPHGNTLTLTITPSNGYKVDDVSVGTKSVVGKEGYSKKVGVVTYKTTVTDDLTIEVKFAQGTDTSSTTDPGNWENPFTDVKADDSFYDAIRFVYQNNLFTGVSSTRFSPDGTMTRAMFVTVLGRLSGITQEEALARYGTESTFKDVVYSNATSWYVPYVAWATENGLIQGYGDGNFGPNNNITHQQMYVIMMRYSAYILQIRTDATGVIISYTDKADIADWAYDAVKYAKLRNFIVLTSTNGIDPKGEAKRYELALLLKEYTANILNWKD